MKQYYQSRLATYTRWIDIALLNFVFGFAYWNYFRAQDISDTYLILQLTLNLSWLGITYLLQTYPLTRLELTAEELIRRFLKAIMFQLLIMAGVLYFTKYGEDVSRFILGSTIIGLALTGGLARLFILKWLRSYRQAGHNGSGFVTIGSSELNGILRQRYEQRRDLGLRFKGTFEFGSRSADEELQRLEAMLESTQPEIVYCCLKSLSPEQVQGIILMGERQQAQIRLVPDFRGFMTHMATMQYHDVVPVIEVSTKPYSNQQDETYKRAFDLAFSILVMLLGAPVFAFVAVAVKILSPGPVFFKQERTGRWGKPFMIYKFRTMYTDADKMGLQHSQGHHDPRVTPIGRILRKTRLDELPQFINVLRGDMSVVGPRPLYRYDVDMLMAADPIHFKKLLTVKPGITSIGQLKVGYADNLNQNLTRMKFDLQYLRKYSVWYDLYLILLTMQVMIYGKGK
ncbi:sugar transferase [Arundinibacter roseus]|uniref:Sugar transferase n=1 Tax=Arundinibacter roseus TaxID=2070510 RepID=A0A4R4K741_9BACT|nr:sugar transferase [Arundinibacter roseus]TDB63374.1 sugar transferase [Arundinibacter roseus]